MPQVLTLNALTFALACDFCISGGCGAMLEKGTSTEYLMLCSNWMTMFDTILNEGRCFPAALPIMALRIL